MSPCRNFTHGEIPSRGTGGMTGDRRGSVAAPPRLNLGGKIRARRRDCALTLADLAKSTGLSIGFLSQVERDITAPSLSSLALIAALSTRASTISSASRRPSRSITTTKSRQLFAIDEGTLALRAAVGVLPRKAAQRHPHGRSSRLPLRRDQPRGRGIRLRPVRRVRYVLGDRPIDLAAGNSLHFAARDRHRVENPEPRSRQSSHRRHPGPLRRERKPRRRRAGRSRPSIEA